MSSQFKNPEFRARLGEVIGNERPFIWAKRMGISSGGFSRIWNEGTIPGPEILIRIAKLNYVSIDWLLIGRGFMIEPEGQADIIRDIVCEIEKVFQKESLSLPPEKKAELVSMLIEEIRNGEISFQELTNKVVRLARFAS